MNNSQILEDKTEISIVGLWAYYVPRHIEVIRHISRVIYMVKKDLAQRYNCSLLSCTSDRHPELVMPRQADATLHSQND